MRDRHERFVVADRQVTAVMAAAGVPDLEIPSLTEALAEFDAALAAEPEPESDNTRWLREMGIS